MLGHIQTSCISRALRISLRFEEMYSTERVCTCYDASLKHYQPMPYLCIWCPTARPIGSGVIPKTVIERCIILTKTTKGGTTSGSTAITKYWRRSWRGPGVLAILPLLKLILIPHIIHIIGLGRGYSIFKISFCTMSFSNNQIYSQKFFDIESSSK